MVEKTPAQLADEQRFDVGAFAYKDTDGKLYTINRDGKRVIAQPNATALSPENQKLADQVAALLMMQSKVRALNPQDRHTLMEMISGKRRDLDQSAGEGLQTAWQEAKKALGFEMPGSGIMDGLHSIGSGFTAPVTFARELFGAASDIGNQFLGGEVSREDALAFGTAYASARQVAKDGRPADYASGLFSMSTGWTYFKAGFSFLVDQAAGLLEKLPVIGDWVKKQGWFHDKTMAECIDECARGSDNAQVLHELTKLPKIGGLDTQKYGSLVTNGGVVRGVNGQDITVAAADSEHAGPTTPGTETPTNTADAATKRDKERKSLAERLSQTAGEDHFSGTREKLHDAGFVGTVLGGGALGGLAYQSGRGVAEGTVRQWSARPEKRMNAAADLAKEYAQQAKALREGKSGFRFWEGDEGRAARATELERKAAEKTAEAAQHMETAMERAPAAGSFTAKAKAPVEGKGVAQAVWNAPRKVGRGVGDMVGFVGEGAVHKGGETVVKTTETVVKLSEAAIKAGEGLTIGAKLGRLGLVAAKFGRSIPIVGGLFGLGMVAYASSANADTVDGNKLSYTEQLDHDRKIGKINDKEYAYYRGLQTAYVATGLGGVITAGITEAAQNGLEYADPVKMDKYLPESLVKLVKGMVTDEKPTALTNEQLVAAHAGVVEQARKATTVAAKPLVNFNLGTKFAAVDSTTIGGFSNTAAPAGSGRANNALQPGGVV